MDTGERTILLVEDQAIVALAEKRQLERAGYRVMHVLDGPQAIETLRKPGTDIDLILMDIDLGSGMDGTQTAEEILKTQDLPIVFLSGHAEPAYVQRCERIASYGYVVKGTGETVLLASIASAFRLHEVRRRLMEANAELARREEDLATTVDSIGDAVITTDGDGSVMRMNPVAEHLTGWTREEAVGRPLVDVFRAVCAKTGAPIADPVKRVIGSGETVSLADDTILHASDGREYRIADNAAPIRTRDGALHGVVLVFRDVTAHHQAQEAIRERELYLDSIFASVQDRVTAIDSDFTIRYVSAATREHYETGESLVGRKCYEAFHDLIDVCPVCPAQRSFERGEVTAREIPDTPDSPTRWLSAVTYPVKDRETGTVEGVLALVHDITEQKKEQQETERLLREKEVLLKEAHHRIKNNISTIVSLLSLQERGAEGECAANALRDARGRMQSMSLLYEILFRSENLEEMSTRDFLPPLVARIRDTFPEGDRIAVTSDAEDIPVGAKVLSTLGIIVNELITNAVKHAFPGGRAGTIGVTVERREGRVALVIEDNGIGLPESFEGNTGLGLTIVEALTEQIDGTLSIGRDGGTRFELDFDPGV